MDAFVLWAREYQSKRSTTDRHSLARLVQKVLPDNYTYVVVSWDDGTNG